MRTKETLFYSIVILAVSVLLMFVKDDVSWAKSMTSKVSHQFAAGDVRDQMGRVSGEMVTKRTNRYRPSPEPCIISKTGPW